MPEIYISTDIETDGPIPGPNSMLSFASAAFKPDGTRISTFSANLELLPDAVPNPSTMAFWNENPEAYAATRTDLKDPADAMKQYVEWIKSLGGKPVFAAYPAGFDFLFVYWYLIRFAGESPFSFSALDIKTYAMAQMKTQTMSGESSGVSRKMVQELLGIPAEDFSHDPVDDASRQGRLYFGLRALILADDVPAQSKDR